jgi:exodeoxyribonuclease V gamma subunit
MRLWQAPHLGSLATSLIESLARSSGDPIADLLRPKVVVVPNPVARSYVLQAIARSPLGAAFNIQTPSLGGLLAELRRGDDGESRVISHACLRAALLAILLGKPKAVALPDAVEAYLEPPAGVRWHTLRAFQLAERLASLFYSYALESPELIDSWSRGLGGAEFPDTIATETWQRALWQELFGKGGLLAKGWVWPLAATGEVVDSKATLPERIHVFGYTSISAGEGALLARLARRTEVELYLPMPAGAPPASPTDVLDELVGEWSAVHRGTLRQLGLTPAAPPAPAPGASVLACLQSALLSSDPPAARVAPDTTFRILASHGIRRECEAIADEIWRAMVEDEAAGTAPPLRFSDVAVLVASRHEAKAYAAELKAACAENHGISLNLGGILDAEEATPTEAALALLDLPGSGFTRSAMLAFLGHPAVCRRFDVTPELWSRACSEAGIFQGADRADGRNGYLDADLHNWDQGLKRLALGELMGDPAQGEEFVVTLGSDDYLPASKAGGRHGSIAMLLIPARTLIADIRRLESLEASLADWGAALATLVDAFIDGRGANAAEHRAVTAALRALGDEDPTAGALQVDVAVACAAARAALAGSRGFRGHLLAHGVHVGPLATGASLPFRVVIVCGLADAAFPARQAASELDVRPARLAAVSRRQRDLAAFVEQVAAARDRLVLSYVGWDEATGAAMPPAAPIRQLQELLECRVLAPKTDPSALVVEHPLHRFAAAYEMAGELSAADVAASRLVSFSPEACREAAAHKGAPPPPPGAAVSTPVAATTAVPPLTLGVTALRDFMEEPLQAWAKHILGIRELSQTSMGDDADDEPLGLDLKGEMITLRNVFEDAIIHMKPSARRPTPDELRAQLRPVLARREATGSGPAGPFRLFLEDELMETLEAWSRCFEATELARRAPFGRVRF